MFFGFCLRVSIYYCGIPARYVKPVPACQGAEESFRKGSWQAGMTEKGKPRAVNGPVPGMSLHAAVARFMLNRAAYSRV
jgi:hypothetical protein